MWTTVASAARSATFPAQNELRGTSVPRGTADLPSGGRALGGSITYAQAPFALLMRITHAHHSCASTARINHAHDRPARGHHHLLLQPYTRHAKPIAMQMPSNRRLRAIP